MRQASLSIEHALLGFLRQEPKHGYAIHQQLCDANSIGSVWRLPLSQLYALLGKLENAGYLTTTTEPQENKPPRKLFHLTDQGEAAFLTWVQEPVYHGRSLRLEFLVKLYFARREGAGMATSLLAAQREKCQEWLVTEQAMLDREIAGGREYGRLVHQFRLGQIQAMLTWLAQCEATR